MIWLLRLNTLLKDLILPPAGPLLIALLGLALLKARPLLARAFLVTGVASLWLLSTPIVSDALTGIVELYPPLDLHLAAHAQAIVILGGGGQRALAPEYGGPAAEPLLLERLSYGAYIAKSTGLPILITGFSVEAHAMHDTLQRNFGAEARWIDHGFNDAGFDVVPAPVGILAARDFEMQRYLPNVDALPRSQAAIYELIGEAARIVLSATHLRRQQAPDPHPLAVTPH